MEVIFQKGDILKSPPMCIEGVQYTVINTDSGDVCMVLHSLDRNTVLAVDAKDPRFDSILATLGIEKNHSHVKQLDVG